ncbi:MAG: nucleoside-diphosphate sugar epimerase/dehydratase, partial [Candidatus Kapaibacteriota bacterium]
MKSLREKLQYSSPILFEIAFDIVAITISYIIHYYIRFESGLFDTDIHPSFVDAFITGTIILLYWLIAFFFAGLYRNWFVRSPFDEFFAVIKTSFFFNFLLFFFVFLDSSARPRLLFLIYFIDITFFVLLGRFLARRLQKYLRQKKIIQVPVVVLGTTQEVLDLMKKVQSYPEWGFDVRAIILLSEEDQSLDVGVPIYKFSDLEKVLEKYHPRELFIAIDKPNHEMLLEIANKCAERQIV